MKFVELKNFDQLYYKTLNDFKNDNPIFKKNIKKYISKQSDYGSITGNQTKFSTDAGSITGNQCKFSTDPGSITGNQIKSTGIFDEQAQAISTPGMTTTSTLGPATPSDSLANFCTANQKNPPNHQDKPGINTSDITQIYSPGLPYKKSKKSKINRKYPLFSRFK